MQQAQIALRLATEQHAVSYFHIVSAHGRLGLQTNESGDSGLAATQHQLSEQLDPVVQQEAHHSQHC